MENCEYIECITKHKCPKSYCVPYGYICDGKWDCWDGSDQIKCQARPCINKYKCHNSLVCLPLALTCDKKNDCSLEDDEHFCYFCLPNCFCLGFAISCKIANINTKEQSKSFYVFVFINLTNSVSFSPLLVHNASRLILCHNQIDSLWQPMQPYTYKFLYYLDMGRNIISTIKYPPKMLLLPNLRSLNITNNVITDIEDFSFTP